MGIDKGGSSMAVNCFHISNPFASKTALSKQRKNGPQGVDLATPRLDQLQDLLEPQRQPLRPLRQRSLLPTARFRRDLRRSQPVLEGLNAHERLG